MHPNLVSNELREFFLKNGINLINPSPHHPASNGLAERAVRTFKEGMKKLQSGTLNTKLCRFLYTYRRTIQSVTKESPAELMFNRRFKSPSDVLKSKKGKVEEENKMSKHNDSKVNENNFFVGQAVFAKKISQGSPWLPAVVIEVKGVRNYVVRVPRNDGDLYWRRHTDNLKERSNADEQFQLPENPVTSNHLPSVLDYDLTGHNQNNNFNSNGIHNKTNNGCSFDNDDLESLSSNMSNEKIASPTPVSNSGYGQSAANN